MDDELIRMAAFKVRESATRMMTLARQARSQRARLKLLSVCRELLKNEAKLLELAVSLREKDQDCAVRPLPSLQAVAGRAR